MQTIDFYGLNSDQQNTVLSLLNEVKQVLTRSENNIKTLTDLETLFVNIVKTDAANEINKGYDAVLSIALLFLGLSEDTYFCITDLLNSTFPSLAKFA